MQGARIEARVGKHLGTAPAFSYSRHCHYPYGGSSKEQFASASSLAGFSPQSTSLRGGPCLSHTQLPRSPPFEQTEQLCGPLFLRPSSTHPRGVGWGSLPYEESYPFHHLGPLVAKKALLCRLDRTGDEPATEAHHLSNRGSHFSGVYPP